MVCASATTTDAPGTRRAAASIIDGEMSTPTASVPAATAASSSAPVPHPMSSTRVAPARSAAATIASVTGVKLESMRRSFSAHR